MNVLSLFDGISCGQVALNRAGIRYSNYYASEIDKYAIQIAQDNYPKTIQLGDVCEITEVAGVDLLIGGSPCQGFSFAGKQLNFNDPRSITDINTLKSKCLSAREYEKNGRQGDYVVCFSTSGRASSGVEFRMSSNEKAHTVSCGGYSSRSFSGVLDLAKLKLRKLTPIECERLQTLPDNYTELKQRNVTCYTNQEIISNTQRYKMIGNGWTVDVIAHILKNIK